MIHYENIPDELKRLPQWVCAYKTSKVPMQAFTNKAASSSDKKTWSTFDTAFDAVSKGYYDYMGFVFNNNGIVGIDLDVGYDGNGFINPTAANIINKCKSYTEKSRSGRGFHIMVKGVLPFKGKNNLAGIEIYQESRYFIMTGDTVFFNKIIANQEAIDSVLDIFFRETKNENGKWENKQRAYSPLWETPKDRRVKLRPIYPEIPNGSRNICLTSLAGALHNLGYNKQQLYNELIICNETACHPPLGENELQAICNSITRYKR